MMSSSSSIALTIRLNSHSKCNTYAHCHSGLTVLPYKAGTAVFALLLLGLLLGLLSGRDSTHTQQAMRLVQTTKQV